MLKLGQEEMKFIFDSKIEIRFQSVENSSFCYNL